MENTPELCAANKRIFIQRQARSTVDVEKAIETARVRIKWKKVRPSQPCQPAYGDIA